MMSSAKSLRLTCVNDVEPQPLDHVWPGRLARGHITLMAGDPGSGKTQIACDIAARITTGESWPDGNRAPIGSVVMLSAEDPVKDVLRPRLEAAGADLRRIHVVEAAVDDRGKERTFNLKDDIEALRQVVTDLGDVVQVNVDPVTSYMGSNIDSHRTTDVRAVLEPFARFAEEMNVALLCISHPPKAAQGKAINAVTGSLAFVAAARMVFLVSEEPETQRRLLLPVKNNLGAPAPGLGYRLAQRVVSKGIVSSHVVWDSAPVTMSANEAIQQAASGTNGKIVEAKEFLREELASGPVSATDITAAAERMDISARTLRRARNDLGVKVSKTGFQGQWVWELPEAPAQRWAQ